MNNLEFRYFDSVGIFFQYSSQFDWPDNFSKLEKFFSMASRYANGVVQQYTGLTDSTGKKIFEGDIIVESDTRYNDLPYEIKYCRHSYSQILAFHPVSKNNDHLNYHYGEWYGKQVTVIGNIFENPELLK